LLLPGFAGKEISIPFRNGDFAIPIQFFQRCENEREQLFDIWATQANLHSTFRRFNEFGRAKVRIVDPLLVGQ
jgi:hypothetical protein